MSAPTIDLDELLSRVRQTVPPPVTLTFWLDPVDQGARAMTDDARALLRCQAYSAYLTRHVLALIRLIDGDRGTLRNVREALAVSIREAKAAAEREGSAG